MSGIPKLNIAQTMPVRRALSEGSPVPNNLMGNPEIFRDYAIPLIRQPIMLRIKIPDERPQAGNKRPATPMPTPVKMPDLPTDVAPPAKRSKK